MLTPIDLFVGQVFRWSSYHQTPTFLTVSLDEEGTVCYGAPEREIHATNNAFCSHTCVLVSYTVHSGLIYGAHFVLYQGSPERYHSRYCVHVMDAGGGDSWGHMKNMTRLMPDIAKCLLVCGVSYDELDSGTHCVMDHGSLDALTLASVSVLAFSRVSEKAPTRGRAAATASFVGSAETKKTTRTKNIEFASDHHTGGTTKTA
ncbi:unnamed protein product [Choristocarpus tenellus]